MLDPEAVAGAFAEGDRRHRRVRDLAHLLGDLAQADGTRARVDAVVALGRWAAERDRRLPLPYGAASEPPDSHRRLSVLVAVLERPDVQPAIAAQLAALLAETEGVRLLAGAGLPSDRGLGQETADRLFRRILPTPRDDRDLGALLLALFPHKREERWLEDIGGALFLRLSVALGFVRPGKPPGKPEGQGGVPGGQLLGAVADALVLIVARVQGLGLSDGIFERGRRRPLARSPFLALARAGDQLVARIEDGAGRADAAQAVRAAIAGCRAELGEVLAHLETAGVSLDVVYTIEVIEQSLARLECLLEVLAAAPGPERVGHGFRLVGVLVRARLADRSLRALAYENLHLLARKLVERAGQTGEHYITTTRREYWQMLGSASGGGLITLGTAALKLQITSWHLPLFFEGLAAGTNFALSFCLIQLLGFTLATKQPSMTAATLAGTIGETGDPRRLQELVGQVARIVRSQLAAAIGNVTTVALAAVVFEVLWRWRRGFSFVPEEKAEAILRSLHPFHSGTIWYAALTGVILWASSLVGGWLENFAVYHRLPQAIAEHRLQRLLGARFMHWSSGFFARNVSGYGSSIALGLMLGMTPSLGAFFGLPLDVRHVTLSTGTLVLALSALTGDGAPGWQQAGVLPAVAGIAIIFVANLGVSFFLALTVALRAREVPRRARWSLLSAILGRFLRRPQDFLFPPGNQPAK